MNSFGRLFRVSILGESHGPAVGVLIDGCPAGLQLAPADLVGDLERRRGATREGTTARRETDVPIVESGVYEGRTTGTPLLVRFANEDADASAYAALRDTPRPGHADLVARLRHGGFADPGAGHHSGRLTVGLVAAGAVAKKLLRPAEAVARVVAVGGSAAVADAVAAALAEGDSVGGLVECRVTGLPLGLGEPFFDSAESLLAHAAFAIPAVKGVEFGAGFAAATMRGSVHNDPILDAAGHTATNHAGGVTGGLTNGNEVVLRVAVKPTPSIRAVQRTVDLASGRQVELSVGGRHDACVALRVPPVLEAVTAIVLVDLMLLAGRLPRVLPQGDAG